MKNKIVIFTVTIMLLFVSLILLPGAIKIDSIPDRLYINENEPSSIDVEVPIIVKISSNENIETLKFNGDCLSDNEYFRLKEPITIESIDDNPKNIDFDLKLLGILPVKRINVNVDKRKKIYPGGQSIGVALFTKGALVVGTSDINISDNEKVNPAQQAGIHTGDVIISVNNEKIKNASDLSEKINKNNAEQLNIGILRDGVEKDITVKAALDKNDKKYKIGVWVRDSTAGVGTLTFVDPLTGMYGGLGHAITDVDTGKVLTIEKGEIVNSQILEVVKAENGKPGELKGYFSADDEKLGNIEYNTRCGIFGEYYNYQEFCEKSESIYLGRKEDVEIGEAYILSTIDDEGVKKYDCEIIDISHNYSIDTKSFVIKITDDELIRKTGGIIQGMSGSPIIQDDKLIGAVTHVFVNDPTKGYGIFIDSMMSNIDSF